ncbi:MAG TPA: AMP-dependent synthetase, partial [Solirubrobacterales bacterium]|nr:AMP-dependent synthetase [Solirubrobacterales bacterium]
PDPERGSIVKAVVVLREGHETHDGGETESLVSELQEHCRRETAPYKYPRVVEFIDELPKTTSGKIRRAELRAREN